MINWITDDHGNQIFTHEGWSVRILSPECECKLNRIQVSTPHTGVEVEVAEEGVWVKGGDLGPRTPTPWEVIVAIWAARQIVTEE